MNDAFYRCIRAIPCPYCGAQPGDRCATRSGRTYQYLHATRERLPFEVFLDGRRVGYSAGVRTGERLALAGLAERDDK